MSGERKNWRTGEETDRSDYLGEHAEVRETAPDAIVFVTVQKAGPDDESVPATPEEVRAWAADWQEYCAAFDAAAERMEAAEKTFAAEIEAFREAAANAYDNYRLTHEALQERLEEEAEAEREAYQIREREKADQAALLAAEEDRRIGPREWAIQRPERNSWETGLKPDSWVPVVHLAKCRIAAKHNLPRVRIDEVSDAALAGGPEINPATGTGRHRRMGNNTETGKTLPVRWCGACRAAKTVLDRLGEAQPRWRADVEQLLADAAAEARDKVPTMDEAAVKRFLAVMGMPVHRPLQGDDPGADGFDPVAPMTSRHYKTLKNAETWTVNYRLSGGYILSWRDLEDGSYPEVLEHLQAVEEKAAQHGYKALWGGLSRYFTVRRMSQNEKEA